MYSVFQIQLKSPKRCMEEKMCISPPSLKMVEIKIILIKGLLVSEKIYSISNNKEKCNSICNAESRVCCSHLVFNYQSSRGRDGGSTKHCSIQTLSINSKRKTAVVQEHSDSPCSAEISATDGALE